MREKKSCKVKNCNREFYSLGFCVKHYQQFKRYGKIKERTTTDPNDYCYIPWANLYEFVLRDKLSNPIGTFIIDEEDFEKVSKHKWKMHGTEHVSTIDYSNNKKQIYLHRLIMDIHYEDKNIYVDHINGNTFDNRKHNLRIVTPKENGQNRKTHKNNKTGISGVMKRKDTGKYRVTITVDRKKINLGNFKDFEEACKIREEAEIKYYGEYRRLKN